MEKPLEGIRILDLSRILAGPYCSMLLADMGAEVIKVERPGKGDDTRAFGPPFIEGESAYFLSINRGKKSITVNFKKDKGREIIYQLIKKSDVLLENFRPGTLDKIGLGYETIEKINPQIIYTSISGFGQIGPERLKAGYDLTVQGMGGIMSLTGDPSGPPYKVGTSISDILAGIYACQGILLALIARNKNGKGQKVDVSMLDCQVSLLTYQAGIYFATGLVPKRKGNQHPTICPYETFKASDEYINIAIGNDKLWQKFCDLLAPLEKNSLTGLGLKEIKDDPKFSSNPKRVENRDELFLIIGKIIREKKAQEWLKIFDGEGIPAGPILSVDKVLSHPQVLAQEMVVEVNHPKSGKIKLTGIPVKLSATPGSIDKPPPLLGEHNDEVLSHILGYSKEEIKSLKEEGVI
ncbi:MAG TPA: CoA transferase [bacterium]|nr:CoA transferase [bacterium]